MRVVLFCRGLGGVASFFCFPPRASQSSPSPPAPPSSSLNRTTIDDRLASTLAATRNAVDGRLEATREAVGERMAATRNSTRAAFSDRLTVRVNARPATTLIIIAASIPALTIAAAVVAVYAAVRARAARAAARATVLATRAQSPVMAPVAVGAGKARDGAAAVTAVVASGKQQEGPTPPASLPVQFGPPASGVGTGMSTPRSRRGTPRGG